MLYRKQMYLKNASHRLGMPKAADITKARALATRRGNHWKLNISYGHELINWEMSVYFDNIGLMLQLIEKRFELMRIYKRASLSRSEIDCRAVCTFPKHACFDHS